MARAYFGTVRKLPSGRFQARYTGPDDGRYSAGSHDSKKDAHTALAAVQADIATQGDSWMPPGVDPAHDEQTKASAWAGSKGLKLAKTKVFGTFAREVLEQRAEQLAPRTLENYESLLKNFLLPPFENLPLPQITVHRVDQWWATMATTTGKVNRRNAYFLLSNIMRYAVRYKYIASSPCVIEKAGEAVARPRPYLSIDDFRRIVAAAPDDLYAPLWVLFGAHVRLGELVGLNRGDVDLETGVIVVDKQAQQARGGLVIRETKTGNRRAIVMLALALEALTAHLEGNTDSPGAPLFRGPKGGRLSRGYIDAQWRRAREIAGLPDAHIHDIRHTGLTLVAGFASTKEVMNRGGHSTAAAALKYQHATAERDALVAAAASAAMKAQ
jgi:integrase